MSGAAAAAHARPGYVLSAVAQLVGRFGNMAANILSLALVARALPPDRFGVYVLVTGLTLLLAQVADFGTGPIFGQHVGSLARPRLPGGYWGSFLLLRGGLGLLATLLGLLVSRGMAADAAGSMLLVSLSATFVAARFLDPLYQVAQRPLLSTLTHLTGASAIVAAAGLASLFCPTLTCFLLGFIAANLAYTATALLAARPLITPPLAIDATVLRRTLTLAAPIGCAGVLTAINGRANLLFLEHYQGAGAIASYGAATRVLDLAINLAVVVLAPLIPVFSQSALAGRDALAAEVRRATRLLLQAALPLLVATPYLSPLIVRALYGARYDAAAGLLDVLAFAGVGVGFALLASYALLALRVTRYAIWITGTAMIANLSLNALLVPGLGPFGAALAAVGTEAVLVALVTLALLRHVPAAIDGRGTVAMLAVAAGLAIALHLLAPTLGRSVVLLVLLPGVFTLRALLRERRRLSSPASGGRAPQTATRAARTPPPATPPPAYADTGPG